MVGRILTQLKRQGQLIEPPRSGVTGSRRALRPHPPNPKDWLRPAIIRGDKAGST